MLCGQQHRYLMSLDHYSQSRQDLHFPKHLLLQSIFPLKFFGGCRTYVILCGTTVIERREIQLL